MTNTTLGKVLGWGQFAFNILGQLLGGGVPTTAPGWLGLLGSLAAAVGIHAASSTDGAK